MRACGDVEISDGSKIVFPNLDRAPVVLDPSLGPNCYRMSGLVTVRAPITGKLFAYVEARNGTTSKPTPCRDQQPDGCRGIGSWCAARFSPHRDHQQMIVLSSVYCDLCSSFHTLKHNEVRVESKKGDFNCRNGIKAGVYGDTSLIFCLPKLDDFLESQGIDRKSWDQFIGRQVTLESY